MDTNTKTIFVIEMIDSFLDYKICAEHKMINEENFEVVGIENVHIKPNDIINKMPNSLKIDHVVGSYYSGFQWCMSNFFREDNLDGFVTAYGNKRAALLLFYYKINDYTYDNDACGTRHPILERLPEINYLGFQIHSDYTYGDIEMLSELGCTLQKCMGLSLKIRFKDTDNYYFVEMEEFLNHWKKNDTKR